MVATKISECEIELPTDFDELYRRLVEPAHDQTLLEINALAHQFARELQLDAETAADVAQDVVCECLLRMRKGAWDADDWADHNVGAFSRRMVQRRALDVARLRRRRARRDADYLGDRITYQNAWANPDQAFDAHVYDALHHELMGSLSPTNRLTLSLVRDRGFSYEEAADYLKVSKSAICARIVRAQSAMRKALANRGIRAPRPRRGTRRQSRRSPP